MYKFFLGKSVVILIICGCSNTKAPTHYKESFTTRISDSGLKHFELRYQFGHEDAALQPPHHQNRQSPRDSAKQFKKERKTLIKRAQEIIAEKQYCEKGFWVIDFNTNRRGKYLRGECNDISTSADRDKFPDTLLRW